MKQIAILLILFFISLSIQASFTFNDNCKQAYIEMMCLRFDAASNRMQSEKNINPDNQVPYIIENYIDFLKVLIGEEEKDFIFLKSKKEQRLQKLAAEGKDSPWYLYSQSLIYLQSGVARIKFGEYVSAGLDVNRAYRLLTENQRKFPDFVMNKAGLGILHSLIGTVPAKYKWAVNSLQFEGTIPEGNSEITGAYQQMASDPQLSFLLPETVFLLTFVTLNLSADIPAALTLVEKFNTSTLKSIINESPLLVYSFANIYSRAGENDKVIQLITDHPHTPDMYPFQYLNFMLGVAKLNRLDKDACYPLLSFLGSFKGKNYIRSAYMHLAWYYFIQNEPQQYNLYIERIKLRGNDQVDNDREAIAFANKNSKPDMHLLKARLLFDGGYYARAKQELDGFKATDVKAGLEYIYRLGRIYHNWGKTDEAISYYTETIKKGENLPYYFAANSSLQLGNIFEKRNDFVRAKKYYMKVLDMNFDEYQFSITNKAQAGLNRIKGK
jgi:tetratricopeptide (TPR) repeat protein